MCIPPQEPCNVCELVYTTLDMFLTAAAILQTPQSTLVWQFRQSRDTQAETDNNRTTFIDVQLNHTSEIGQ